MLETPKKMLLIQNYKTSQTIVKDLLLQIGLPVNTTHVQVW